MATLSARGYTQSPLSFLKRQLELCQNICKKCTNDIIENSTLLYNFKCLTKDLMKGTFIDSSENAKLALLHICITLVTNDNMPFWYLDSKNTKVDISYQIS